MAVALAIVLATALENQVHYIAPLEIERDGSNGGGVCAKNGFGGVLWPNIVAVDRRKGKAGSIGWQQFPSFLVQAWPWVKSPYPQ